jgi:branched-subunit amino acid transport protein
MSILWIIIGMGLATYVPRMLPMVIGQRIAFPEWLKQWLSYVPYAVLGALIFPGILSVDPSKPWVGLIGAGAAIILSLLFRNVIVVVIGGIAVVACLIL